MFNTLLENHENIEARFKKYFKKFWTWKYLLEKLKIKKKYKKVNDWRSLINGPWIHQNIIETIKNIKLNKKFTGGIRVNESDGFCAALPYFLYGYDLKDVLKIIKIVTVSKMSIKYAITKFHLLTFALRGAKNPIKEFTKKFKKNNLFKEIVNDIEKVKKLKTKPHNCCGKETRYGL